MSDVPNLIELAVIISVGVIVIGFAWWRHRDLERSASRAKPPTKKRVPSTKPTPARKRTQSKSAHPRPKK